MIMAFLQEKATNYGWQEVKFLAGAVTHRVLMGIPHILHG